MPVPWMLWDFNDVKLEFGVQTDAFPGQHYHSKWRSENAGSDGSFERELMGIRSNLHPKRCTIDGRWWKQILHHLFFWNPMKTLDILNINWLDGFLNHQQYYMYSVSLNVNPHVLLLRWFCEMSCWCFNFGDSDLMVDVSWKDEIFTEKGKVFFHVANAGVQ